MNIFRGGGERLAVFQPSDIQPCFSRSLSVQQSSVLYLKPVEHPYWFYIHIFSQILQNGENLKCPLTMLFFFPLHILPPFGDSPFFILLCRDDWLSVSGKPVARPICLLNIVSRLQSEEKPLTETPRKRIFYLCTPAAVRMRYR